MIPIINVAIAPIQGTLEQEWLPTRNLNQQVQRLRCLRRRKPPAAAGVGDVDAEVAGGEARDAPARNRRRRLNQRPR